jgi:hypothetical protein
MYYQLILCDMYYQLIICDIFSLLQLRSALEMSVSVLGGSHADTLRVISQLCELLIASGGVAKKSEAERLRWQAVEACRITLGDQHERTLHSSLHLVDLLVQQSGKSEEAISMLTELLPRLRRGFGDHHDKTLHAVYTLASMLRKHGRTEEAIVHFRHALQAQMLVRGGRSKVTLIAIHQLVFTLVKVGEFNEARAVLGDAADVSRDVLGERDQVTLFLGIDAGRLRIATAADTGQRDAADDELRGTVSLLSKELGLEHPTTRSVCRSLCGSVCIAACDTVCGHACSQSRREALEGHMAPKVEEGTQETTSGNEHSADDRSQQCSATTSRRETERDCEL